MQGPPLGASGTFLWYRDIARILRDQLPDEAGDSSKARTLGRRPAGPRRVSLMRPVEAARP
jgi:hypothetical protein